MALHNDHRPTIRQRRTWLFAAPTVVIAFALMAACGAADPHVDDEEEPLFGYVRALIDGEPWESTDHSAQVSIRIGMPVFRLRAQNVDELVYPWSDMFSIALPMDNGVVFSTNDLHWRQRTDDTGGVLGERFGMIYLERNGLDAIIGEFHAIEDDSNLLRIDSYDEETGVMEGVFEATLVVDFRHNLAVRPDTFRITEGEFRLLFEDHR